MVAWLRSAIRIRDAESLQGSPSTCTGMALAVVSSTSRHWVSRSPCPPTCSAACGHRVLRSAVGRASSVLSRHALVRGQTQEGTPDRIQDGRTRQEYQRLPHQMGSKSALPYSKGREGKSHCPTIHQRTRNLGPEKRAEVTALLWPEKGRVETT